MQTTAVRIHGVNDLRVDTFDLPPISPDEILAEVITDSICMSSHKLALQGENHKRVRHNLSTNPVMIGHEFCGRILEVGATWSHKFKPGQKFAIQPALNHEGTLWAPGYSFEWIGGDATYVVIPKEVMEMDCLLEYRADAFFQGSLAEPLSCVIGGFRSLFHTEPGVYTHNMGPKPGGTLALLGAVGPMGLGAIDYALHGPFKFERIVVTDISQERLDRAASLLAIADAADAGIELHYVNTSAVEDPLTHLIGINNEKLFDDVICFAPVRQVVELADALLAEDGCMNFFAGPTDTGFMATVNFYGIHYGNHHYVANSGGNTADIIESLELMAARRLNPEFLVTHVGGLNTVPQTTINLPDIPGGKKLIYTHKKLDLVAISDFAERGKTDPLYAELAKICEINNGLWSKEAEDYLLEHAPAIVSE